MDEAHDTGRTPRRPDRQAAVLLRMSPEDRDALNRAAQAAGTTVTDLAHEALRPYLTAGAAG